MTQTDQAIADAIAASIEGTDGRFSIEVEIGEGNRLSGTGAWITTAVRVRVDECRVYEARENGDWTESRLRPDTSAIERYAERLAA